MCSVIYASVRMNANCVTATRSATYGLCLACDDDFREQAYSGTAPDFQSPDVPPFAAIVSHSSGRIDKRHLAPSYLLVATVGR